MYYTRRVFIELKKQLENPEIVVLTGMRRVGKTTIFRMLFDDIKSNNKLFLDMENPVNQKLFEEINFDNVLLNLSSLGLSQKEKIYLFLDEIGAIPNVVRVIKYLYDHYQIKFFLTGSSSFYLKNLFPESLSGRKIIFELFPLDFEEFLQFKKIRQQIPADFDQKDRYKSLVSFEMLKGLYNEYLEYGGFPQVVLTDDAQQKRLILGDIFKSYFEKDVNLLADFKNINLFRDLLLLLLARVGSKIDITKLASEVGISRETVYSYLAFLQGTYFIDLIPSFTGSIDRQISKAKKIYLCDNGLVNHFVKVSSGALFENAVYLNLKKHGKVSYFQKRTGAEIDFILDGIGLEVKETGRAADYKKLARFAKDLKLRTWYIVTKAFVDIKGFIPATQL